MNNAELIGSLIYGGIALGFALSLVLVQGLFLSFEGRYSRWTMPMVPVALCLGMAVSSLLSGRNLKYAAMDVRTINSLEGAGGGSIMRGITAVVLALCFAKIVAKLMQRNSATGAQVGGQALIVTLIFFFFTTHVLSASMGAHPAFIHNSYYPVVVFVALFLARSEGMEITLDWLRTALLLLMLASLLAAVALPELALQTNYPGWIPGFKIRLWGLGSNANSIGPLALLLGLLLYFRPFERRSVNVLAWLALLAVFVMSQSKTVWAAGMVSVLILALYGRGRDAQGRLKPGFLLLILLLAVFAMLGLAVADLGRIADKIAATKVGGEISTLTGRATIWAEAWRTWEANFWFGYGPEVWGPLHRARIGMPFAFHAHNQLMQSLSGAGLFGGVALLAYLVCMVAASVRAARFTRGVSIALAVVMLARFMTEAPLEIEGLFIGETIIHLAWFMVVLVPYAHAKPERQAAGQGAMAGAALAHPA